MLNHGILQIDNSGVRMESIKDSHLPQCILEWAFVRDMSQVMLKDIGKSRLYITPPKSSTHG
jgi:hypothetical protein